jgi:glycosyltransferase involved in cell wall biosynthesis
MKILVIGSLACSLVNFRGELLKSLVSRGHEVVACAPAISTDICKQLTSFGVRCRDVAISRTGLNPVADCKTVFSLCKLFREEKPERILVYTIKPVIYGSLAARFVGNNGMFVMITGLGYAFAEKKSFRHRLVGYVANLLYRQALKSCRGIFFQNPDDLNEFQQRNLIPSKTSTVVINGSGVDSEHFSPVQLPDVPSFLLIARLIIDKGVREYVRAAKIIKKKYPAAKFRLAGWIDTNPAGISEQELEEWQNKGVIEYLGALEDVRPAITDSMVYVLPSYREGTPRTVLEAMSMGRPIITSDAPGCRETVKHGENGFLIPPRNIEALARAMETFITEPKLACQMGERSRMIAVEKYDVHKVNKVILDTMGC